MSKFIVEKFENMQAYVAGEQPKLNEYIKLNTNESPFKPNEKSIEKVAEYSKNLNIYNDTWYKNLAKSFSKYYKVEEKNVIFGNGSDEILAFCFLAYTDEKIGVCYPEISYGFYKVFSKLFCAKDEKIALKDDLSIDISHYFNKNKTIIIANPNAPTGISLDSTQIEQIIIKNPNNIVIIDEAYVDFGGESVVELTKKYNNLIVCGTFSKSRNLAGARLGYAIACEELIADLNKIRNSFNPYNVNSLTQILGQVSIESDGYFKECIEKIVNAREFFVKELKKMNFATLDSKANFVFTKNEKIDGKELYEKLKNKKILVRHFENEKISKYVRISIGTMEQMEKVVQSIKEILEESDA